MSYKIRRLKSPMSVCKSIEADKTWQREENRILKKQVESLKLELCYKNNELRLMNKSGIEDNLYSIVSTMILNIDDAEQLTQSLLLCDYLLQNALAKLQNAIDIYNSSANE
jgi:hypothetical protein